MIYYCICNLCVCRSYREKLETIEKKAQAKQNSSTSKSEVERKDVMTLLNREKEQLLDRVLELEKNLLEAEQRCLLLGENLLRRESEVEQEKCQLQHLLAEKTENLDLLQRKYEDLTHEMAASLLKQKEEEASCKDQQLLLRSAELAAQHQQFQNVIEEMSRLKAETLSKQQAAQAISEQWEEKLKTQQRHFAAELASRDLLIHEMQLVSRENASLVRELEKRHEDVLLQYYKRCEELQQQQKQLRMVVHQLLTESSRLFDAEKEKILRTVRCSVTAIAKTAREKEEMGLLKIQQLE